MTGRILIIDGDGPARARLAARLEAAYLEPVTAEPAAARAMARGDGPGAAPDLVLASAGSGGLALLRALKTDPETAALPAVLVAPRSARGARLAALEVGADDLVAPETGDAELAARLRRLLRSKAMLDELRLREDTALDLGLPAPPGGWSGRWSAADAAPARLLVVADDLAAGRRRAAQLAAALDLTASAVEPGLAVASAEADAPDLILLELPEPAERALRLVAAIRARAGLRDAGLVAVLAADAAESAAKALDLGAGDVAAAPPDLAELAARLRAELRRVRRAEALRATLRDGLMMAARDPLTGLHNRRYAEPHLARLLGGCSAAGRPLAVLLLDLDRFKEINDRLGHAAGDAVLRGVAERLREGARAADLVARIGGEEFCVALPDTCAAAARAAAERLRAAVAATPYATPAGPVKVTASFGVAVAEPSPGGFAEPGPAPLHGEAEAPGPGVRAADLIAAADAALYDSKHRGRNRVSMSAAA